MAVKKKEDELDLNEEEMELDEDLELSEPEELGEVAFSEEEEDEEVEEAPKQRKPRKRAPKKEPKRAAMVEAAAEEKPSKTPTKLEEKIEKAFELPAAAAVAPVVTPEALPASASAPAPAHDDLAKQWAAAQQTSASIVASLEKVNTLLREVPEHYAAVIQKAMKQSSGKPSPAAKVAFGMSLVATVLSVLSLTFAQSARQSALSQGVSVPAIHQPVAPSASPRIEANTTASTDAVASKPRRRKSKVH